MCFATKPFPSCFLLRLPGDLHHYYSFCLTPELPFISSYQFSLSSLNVKVKLLSSVELPDKLSLPILFLAKSPLLYYYKPGSRKMKPVFQLVYEASSSLPISPSLFSRSLLSTGLWDQMILRAPQMPISCSWFCSHLRCNLKFLCAVFSVSTKMGGSR